MTNNVLFIVLTFIIVIAIIMVSDNLTTAMLVISIVANFLVISAHFSRLANIDVHITPHKRATPVEKPKSAPEAQLQESDEGDMYGPHYKKWQQYHATHPNTAILPDGCYDSRIGADLQAMNLAQRRARDRRTIDGWLTKDAGYFGYHYGPELADTESKPWWGRHEI